MINNLQISGVHSTLTQELSQYARKKIGRLEKYVPRRARQSLHLEIKLKEKNVKNKRIHECEVIMKLPGNTITAHKDATSIRAAIDEVENNLRKQLKKYKDLHNSARMRRHIMGRFKKPLAEGEIY